MLVITELGPSKPRSLCFLFHGYGANKENLLPVAHAWSEALPSTRFILPDAPLEMGPGSFRWFELWNATPEQAGAELGRTLELLTLTVQDTERRFNPEKIFFAGFSQGGMLALHFGLHHRCHGIVSLSGFLAEDDQEEKKHTHAPVCLIHGSQDEVVPPEAFIFAAHTLLKNGNKEVEAHLLRGMSHEISPAAMLLSRNFLRSVMSAESI